MTTQTAPPPTTDEAELRAARRDRVFDAMATTGIDVLVLGRRDSVAYATGARSLWTAGTRPFGPACVLVESARSVHMLSSWDEGIPPDIPFDHLYGVTWNGAVLAGALAGIPGLAAARRIGVEALSPGFEHMVRRLAPEAELVPADDVMRAVRALKLPAEVARIRAAVAVARAAMEAAGAALADGAGPTGARAAALAAAAGLGVTVPTSGVAVTQPDPTPGSPAHVDIGLLVDGYEGGVGRTLPEAGDAPVVAAQRRLVDACRPGATVTDLREAVAAGVSRWAVRGSGMGFEIPVMTAALGRGQVIEEHMVLSADVELDGMRRRDLAVVGAAATEVI
ncbi:MAG TPA: aminopeptidase P family N-terminal domain-containing protein [Acidimicrobiales bacterium]|nr:aminopeptidase P family N-terminal domain-containing protein [Acidimicrobiales bacterium]